MYSLPGYFVVVDEIKFYGIVFNGIIIIIEISIL